MTALGDILLRMGYMRVDDIVPMVTVGEALLMGVKDASVILPEGRDYEWAGMHLVLTKNYMAVLPYAGQPEKIIHLRTDSRSRRYDGWRWLAVYEHKKYRWLFIPGEKSVPGVIEWLPGGKMAWHGRAWGIFAEERAGQGALRAEGAGP